jgi:phenylpyruvate tautomerase PptA (4-oxalocrotonate tautomerase family)
MTVQELIDDLLTVKDKSIEVVIQGIDPTDYVYYNVD